MRLKKHLISSMIFSSMVAFAQTGGTLPLVNVGDGFGWITKGETYTFVITDAQKNTPINLEVYSPGLNLNDYVNGRATTGYYGDEIYGKDLPFASIITLTGPNGKVFERRYENTLAHTWERLISTPLPAGTYTLKVNSEGKGKNAYALRLAGGFNLLSDQFTINARGRPDQYMLAAQLNVPDFMLGREIQIINYDGDGNADLELYADAPDGKRYRLTTSDNGKSATDRFQVTQDLLGTWSIYARIPEKPSQYSNAFNLKLTVNNEPFNGIVPPFATPTGVKLTPTVTVEVVDPQGRPIPNAGYTLTNNRNWCAVPVLPKSYIPVGSSVVEGKGNVQSNTSVCVEQAPAKIRFVAKLNEGKLKVNAVAVIGQNRVPLNGIPFQLTANPGGTPINTTPPVDGTPPATENPPADPNTPATSTSSITARTPISISLPPGGYTVIPTEIPGSSTFTQTGTVVIEQENTVTLEYRVNTEVIVSTSPDVVDFCGNTSINAVAKTLFPYPIKSTLSVSLPQGITANVPTSTTGNLSDGSPLTVSFVAKACANGNVTGTLDLSGLSTTNAVQVRPLSLVISGIKQENSHVRVKKALSFDGKAYNITLNLSVEKAVKNLSIVDALPKSDTFTTRSNVTSRGVNAELSGNTFRLGNVEPGEYTIQYQIFSDLSPEQLLTMPEIGWE
ncbi:hypothetical protein [Deinococcus cellulosilyticus]|nr:hypothetical protein [Deinococcus cellulosilyticus]